jgi:hypothetical protein
MIENDGVALAGFDQVEWARLGDYDAWTVQEGLQMFTLLRGSNLRVGQDVAGGMVAAWGACERGPMTVADLVRHMEQMRGLLGKQGRD